MVSAYQKALLEMVFRSKHMELNNILHSYCLNDMENEVGVVVAVRARKLLPRYINAVKSLCC